MVFEISRKWKSQFLGVVLLLSSILNHPADDGHIVLLLVLLFFYTVPVPASSGLIICF